MLLPTFECSITRFRKLEREQLSQQVECYTQAGLGGAGPSSVLLASPFLALAYDGEKLPHLLFLDLSKNQLQELPR